MGRDDGQADGSRDGREFAIKKFKPDKEGEAIAHYSGISQSAVREMAVPTFSPCRLELGG